MRIIFFTRYDKLGSSSRYRFYNFKGFFNSNYKVNYLPFFNNAYLKNKYLKKNNFLNILFSYLRRFYNLLTINKSSLIIIEKELLPFAPFFLEKLFLKKKKYILDFDDAIYLNYKKSIYKYFLLKNKIEKLATQANKIFVGSDNLYNYFIKYNSNIILIPTVVNHNKYNLLKTEKYQTLTIVWIGTPSTVIYLKSIIPILIKLKKKYQIDILSIGARVESKFIKSLNWSEEMEILFLKKSHIGVMPLFDDEWSRSKCGFKILQYMASNLPVVASRVGQNKKILKENMGFLVDSNHEWYDKLEKLIINKKLREDFGMEGYKRLVSKYSYQSVHQLFIKEILKI